MDRLGRYRDTLVCQHEPSLHQLSGGFAFLYQVLDCLIGDERGGSALELCYTLQATFQIAVDAGGQGCGGHRVHAFRGNWYVVLQCKKNEGDVKSETQKGGLCQPHFLTHPVGNFLEGKPCQGIFQVSTRKADRYPLLFHLFAKLLDLGVVPVEKRVGIRVPAKKSDHATDATIA